MKIHEVAPKFIYVNSSIFEELSKGSKGAMVEWIKEKKLLVGYVAIVDKVVVGWSTVSRDPHLPSVFVNPAFRHQGIGKKLGRKVYPLAEKLLLADFK
jgi:GNAT superfamily N-acetyltransferase